jgi:hypothetical protein
MKLIPLWLYVAILLLFLAGGYAFADAGKPIIRCGTLIGSGEIRFAFPDKTFVIKIDCPKGDV